MKDGDLGGLAACILGLVLCVMTLAWKIDRETQYDKGFKAGVENVEPACCPPPTNIIDIVLPHQTIHLEE